ncbi:hypothetical protein MWU65_17120, partial [Cellulophaga sp. F20128]|uniref:hypothetical protein n=1 Tax=Cellulophaga sp. F20128 TaxID=2926413 RepID=UPI001FF5ED39
EKFSVGFVSLDFLFLFHQWKKKGEDLLGSIGFQYTISFFNSTRPECSGTTRYSVFLRHHVTSSELFYSASGEIICTSTGSAELSRSFKVIIVLDTIFRTSKSLELTLPKNHQPSTDNS